MTTTNKFVPQSDVNTTTFTGRVVKDAVLNRTTKDVPYALFSIASNRVYYIDGQPKEITTFLDCKVWRELAEESIDKLKKGAQVIASGILENDSREDKKSNVYLKIEAINVRLPRR